VKIVWTFRAIRDLVDVRAYVERDNSRAAAELSRRILRATARLTKHPEIGRRGKLAGTCELIVARTPYLIPCRIRGARIEWLRVLHGMRRYPPGAHSS